MKRLPLTWNDSTLHLDIIQFGKFVEWSYSDLFLRAAEIWNKINERSSLDNYICYVAARSSSWSEGNWQAKPLCRDETITTTTKRRKSDDYINWIIWIRSIFRILLGQIKTMITPPVAWQRIFILTLKYSDNVYIKMACWAAAV